MKVMKLEKRKCFSLYINGKAVKVPQKPEYNGDLISYKDGMKISIGDTILGKELTWFCAQFDTGAEVWFCDRNLMNQISLECMISLGLTKKRIQVEGRTMELSLPALEDSEDEDCEWTALMNFLDNDPENSFHWKGCFSSGDDSGPLTVILRGYLATDYWGFNDSDLYYDDYGWRPALRILPSHLY